MNFYPIHDLHTNIKNILKTLSSKNEIIPSVRQAKAMIALNSMRHKAAKAGFLTDEEIESVIADVRKGNWDK